MWRVDSWREKNYLQKVNFPNEKELQDILLQLNSYPALVTLDEIIKLQYSLAEAAKGNAFIIQGGDCVEQFASWDKKIITKTIQLLAKQALIGKQYLHKNITLISRSGQYAKPRTSLIESQKNIKLPSYRGDMIHQYPFDAQARIPNPSLMDKAYHFSRATFDHIRMLCQQGIQHLVSENNWDNYFLQQSPFKHMYKEIIKSNTISECEKIFFSREALILEYEQQFTKPINGKWYNFSTHFPWIGMRTLTHDSAHVEYMRGIQNPIAIKVGPNTDIRTITALSKILNPENIPGRLTIIHRLGINHIETVLPTLIKEINEMGVSVLWMCDPMHGNTHNYQQIKTRGFDDILLEIIKAAEIHKKHHTYLGGVHLEMTGDDVTECFGGFQNLTKDDLHKRYLSPIDPRLNQWQALDLVLLLGMKYPS